MKRKSKGQKLSPLEWGCLWTVGTTGLRAASRDPQVPDFQLTPPQFSPVGAGYPPSAETVSIKKLCCSGVRIEVMVRSSRCGTPNTLVHAYTFQSSLLCLLYEPCAKDDQ